MRSSARAARLWFLIALPVLGGAFAILGAVADPTGGASGIELMRAYGENPNAMQWNAIGYHFAYTWFLAAAAMLASFVRGRGAWLANVGGFLAILGISTIPGFLLADFYDSSISRLGSPELGMEIERDFDNYWGLMVLGITGTMGFLFALPVTVIAAIRAGLLPIWSAVAVIGGFLSMHVLGPTVVGVSGLAAGFTLLTVALYLHRARLAGELESEPAARPARAEELQPA